jgi:hypothetical protein
MQEEEDELINNNIIQPNHTPLKSLTANVSTEILN